jgi:hypothetical protein
MRLGRDREPPILQAEPAAPRVAEDRQAIRQRLVGNVHRPGRVQLDRGATLAAEKRRRMILHVAGAGEIRRARPHVGVRIALHATAEGRIGCATGAQHARMAHQVKGRVEKVHPKVDQRTTT